MVNLGSQYPTTWRPDAVAENATMIMHVLQEGTFINPKTNKTVWFLQGLDADGCDMRIYVHEIRPVPATNLKDTKQLLNKKVTWRSVTNVKGFRVWEPVKIE